MYLTNIHFELDPSYPADDQSALELFHRKRTLRLLKAVYDRIGQEAYRRMVAAVPRFGAACGFTEEEIRAVVPGEGYYARSDEFVPQGDGEEEDEEEGRTELMMAAVLKYIQMKHKLSESDSMFSSLSLSLCFNLYIDRYGMCSLMHTLFSIYDCLFENW